jgi:hypothetical protein
VTPEPLELIAASPAELGLVVDFIAGADLELVAVIAIVQPRADADGELVLLFGDESPTDGAAA